MANKLTADRLRELVDYDPETGAFVWIVKSRPACRVGDPCGRISRQGYHEIGLDYVLHRANRLAWLYMTGEWPDRDVDHINRNKSDNRWANLRLATRSQNSANVSIAQRRNTSGYLGVTFDKSRDKWRAQIRIKGRKVNLGRFACPIEAAKAHDAAAWREFGEFAELNFGRDDARTKHPDREGICSASGSSAG